MLSNEPRRYLVHLERTQGPDLFLGTVEGTPVEMPEKLKQRWPTFSRSMRLRLEEVRRDG